MDERKKVLELVAAGQLTVDEGDRILDALDAARSPAPETSWPTEHFAGQRLYESIAKTIESSIGSATRGIRFGSRVGRGRDIDQIVTFAAHGVSPRYVREMCEIFNDELSADEVRELMDHGVKVEYARDMFEIFNEKLSPDDVRELVDHGLKVDYVRDMRGLFNDELSPDDLRELVDHGVKVDYARRMLEIFDDDLSPDDLRELVDHGVKVEFVRDLLQSGDVAHDVDEIIRRRDEG